MEYTNIVFGRFINRPNRFISEVDIQGKLVIAHVKNTGRCKELLIPGSKVILEKVKSPNRKTEYDLISVYKGDVLVNIDSQAPNKVVREYLLKGELIPGITLLKSEKTYGDSRLDFYVETQDGRRIFIEVKGVTLEHNKIALFPDAPTIRGVRHVRELIECVGEGYEGMIIFVIQMKNVHSFQPNGITHPEFEKVFWEASMHGVQIQAFDCLVNPDSISIDQVIPIKI